MKYQDFVVRIGRMPEGRLKASVLRSPAGEGEASVTVPPWLEEALGASAGLDPDVDGSRAAGTSAQRDMKRRPREKLEEIALGRRLYELIFSGVVGRLWDQSLGAIGGRRDAGLRLRLQLDLAHAEFLADLPWEQMCRGDTDAYLSLDRRTPVLRHLEVAQPVQSQPLPASLKVLGVAAAPRELEFLDLATEKQKLEAGRAWRRWQLTFLAQPTVDQLRQALVAQGSHVLHFMGHGHFDPQAEEGALYFEDGKGGIAAWTGRELAATLTGLPALRLVVLNACQTAVSGSSGDNAYGGVAAALVRGGVVAVVAMQRPISDVAAIAFSSAFYRHLADGADLEEALTEGRQAIHTAKPATLEWSIPVLFSRTTDRGLFTRPEETAAWRRRAFAAALGFVLMFSVSVALLRGTLGGRPAYAVQLEQILATGVDGVNGRLVSVEILEDGKMRLHFSFDNRSDEGQLLGFDLKKTYLADEFGNAYEVKASSSLVPGGASLFETVPAGESRKYWMEFQAPLDGARRLHVELATPERSELKFMPFSVVLPEYPRELSPPSPPNPRLAESDAQALDVKLDNGRRDVASHVRQLEVSETGMRVTFDMWNRGSLPLQADFDPSRIELRDGRGNVLKPSRMGTFEQGRESDLRTGKLLRRAVRTRLFLEFPPPRTASEKWELQLATRPDSAFRFAGAAMQVAESIFARARKKIEEFARLARPKLEARPRVDPPSPSPPAVAEEAPPPPEARETAVPLARFEVAGGGEEVQTSREGIGVRIAGIDRLSNQRLRFVVLIANATASPAEIGLWLAGTKLSDDQGRQFRLLASTFGEVGEDGPDEVRFTVAAGTARELAFEFSGRVQGSELFTLSLGSTDPEALRFKPIQTRLPPE